MELPSDYWSGLLPLAALHLLVPPLSGNGPMLALGLPAWLEAAMLALQLPLSRDDVERHFVFSEAARRAGRGYTLATHMLLHESHAHLAANLEGLLVSAGAAHDCGGLALVLLCQLQVCGWLQRTVAGGHSTWGATHGAEVGVPQLHHGQAQLWPVGMEQAVWVPPVACSVPELCTPRSQRR